MDDAVTMLTDTLKWRKEFKVDGILDEKFPEDVFGGVGHVFGHDKEGHPVAYIFPLLPMGCTNKALILQLQRLWWWTEYEGRVRRRSTVPEVHISFITHFHC